MSGIKNGETRRAISPLKIEENKQIEKPIYPKTDKKISDIKEKTVGFRLN